MASFADKLAQKLEKFKAVEKERETTKGSVNTDPTRFPVFKQGDVIVIRLLPPKPVLPVPLSKGRGPCSTLHGRCL